MQLVVLTVYAFLYGKLYLSMSGLEQTIIKNARSRGNNALKAVMATQSIVQLGILMSLPMLMEIGLERGFRTAASDMIIMQLQLSPVFFTFSLGTKVHYFGRTILHGGAKYRATGRGFVVRHEKFADNYRMYSRSHFTKALELMILLIVYKAYSAAAPDSKTYTFITMSMWFLVISWLFAPFLFNPSGFEWQKIVEDFEDWAKWMNSRGGIGVPATKSWESWWDEEQEHLQHTGLLGRLCEIMLSLRFLLYQYGIVYHLHVTRHETSILVSQHASEIAFASSSTYTHISNPLVAGLCFLLAGHCWCDDRIQDFGDGEVEAERGLPAGFQASKDVCVYRVDSDTHPGHKIPGADGGRYFCQFIRVFGNWMGHSAGK